MEDDNITGLTPGLGMGGYMIKNEKVNKAVPRVGLTFELRPKEEAIDMDHDLAQGFRLKRYKERQHPNAKSGDDTNNNNNSRKKLKLTKEQLAFLEDSFKHHSTLNPAQKQALADQLNIKLRQVEVWFQNRRARTKKKQTEVDREFLGKYCEKLTDENLRLKKKLEELRALKVETSPLYLQLSKAITLAKCPSCEERLVPNEEKNAVISNVTEATIASSRAA